MRELFGMNVLETPRERYRYQARTGKCFRLLFALLTGSVEFRTGRYIPDPHFPNSKVLKVWSEV